MLSEIEKDYAREKERTRKLHAFSKNVSLSLDTPLPENKKRKTFPKKQPYRQM